MRYCASCSRVFQPGLIQKLKYFNKGYVCLDCSRKGITSKKNEDLLNQIIKDRFDL